MKTNVEAVLFFFSLSVANNGGHDKTVDYTQTHCVSLCQNAGLKSLPHRALQGSPHITEGVFHHSS